MHCVSPAHSMISGAQQVPSRCFLNEFIRLQPTYLAPALAIYPNTLYSSQTKFSNKSGQSVHLNLCKHWSLRLECFLTHLSIWVNSDSSFTTQCKCASFCDCQSLISWCSRSAWDSPLWQHLAYPPGITYLFTSLSPPGGWELSSSS